MRVGSDEIWALRVLVCEHKSGQTTCSPQKVRPAQTPSPPPPPPPPRPAIGRHPSGDGRYGFCALRARVARAIPRPQRPRPKGGKRKSPFGCGSPAIQENPNARALRVQSPSTPVDSGAPEQRVSGVALRVSPVPWHMKTSPDRDL
jgi:hypothetical protein